MDFKKATRDTNFDDFINGAEETANTVSGCIMSGAAVIAYIIGEGLADSGNGGNGNGEEN